MPAQLYSSLYTICIEIRSENRYLLIHGYTGAMDLVGESVVSFLMRGGLASGDSGAGNKGIREDTVRHLKNRGYLTTLSPDKEREYVSSLARFFHRASVKRSSFVFLVAYDCNFSCSYCFEGAISGSGPGWSKKVMTEDLADKAYAAMYKINPGRPMHDDIITLFGGEPLLEKNCDVVSYIVHKGMRDGYAFAAITNGYTLDKFVDILKPGMLQSLQITLDGAREEHNRFRVHRNNGASFDRIMENIDMALRCGVSVSVRVNVHGGHPVDPQGLYYEFIKRGWVNTGRFTAYHARLRPPRTPGRGHVQRSSSINEGSCALSGGVDALPASGMTYTGEGKNSCNDRGVLSSTFSDCVGSGLMKGSDACELKDEQGGEAQFSESVTDARLGLRTRLNRFFRGETWTLFRAGYCGARTGMVVFDPCGDLYVCLESVGIPEFRIGSYADGFEINRTELDKWREWRIEEEDCITCKYSLICGGGCPADSMLRTGGSKSSKCDDFPSAFTRAVNESYADFKRHSVLAAGR